MAFLLPENLPLELEDLPVYVCSDRRGDEGDSNPLMVVEGKQAEWPLSFSCLPGVKKKKKQYAHLQMRSWKVKAAAEGSQIVTSKPGFGLGPDSKPQARPAGQLVHRSIKATANKCDFSNTLSC